VAPEPILTAIEREILSLARRAVLVTLAPDGRPRPVPICYAFVEIASLVVYTALDDKPKRREDPTTLARVRDIVEDPRISLVADRWDEDWSNLGWVRLDGRATLVAFDDPRHPAAVDALRSRYPQYEDHRLEARPIIEIGVERITSWTAAARGDAEPTT
jgi:PPOX class probable F420-dependent enzyme